VTTIRNLAHTAVAATAARAAAAAADAAGVQIRPLTELADLEAASRLLEGIWRRDSGGPLMSAELLRTMTKADNYVGGAFDGAEMVGVCAGFFGAPSEHALHSHIAGVSAAARGRSVGFALKVHQRAWALERGIITVYWTYDPLIGRNAYFNLVKLGAAVDAYLPNFYGDMQDSINGGDPSDRLLVRWDLCADAVAAACAGEPQPIDAVALRSRGAPVLLSRGDDGRPRPASTAGGADTVLVAVPADVEGLRHRDPDCARAWRTAVHDTLGHLLAEGGRVAGYDRAGWYVVNVGREPR
jgi:predicted GNAT superfamily acetyltransferase